VPTFPKALLGGTPAALPAKNPTQPGKGALASLTARPAAPVKVAPAAAKVAASPPAPRPAARPPAGSAAAGDVLTAEPASIKAIAAKPAIVPPPRKAPTPAPSAATPALALASSSGGEPPRLPAKGRFTLQLGSFPDRAEAEAFARRFGAGPYVVESDIPGKGIWFRVRVGDYPSPKEAIAAKASFEKQHNVIAYVVPPVVPR
jgi:septal ring-binding cell division protein DamX